ncbi:cyclin-T1-4 [Rosa chinensis]|uniref:cyclin-T1-4 n=1 Tax=Rosa chinensis TaxID=74649 RepID=UPI001AD8DD93|nr:cyclin-T1-4 [Rosa chinensis]
MLCHCFYMHQSHAKNDWPTIATACILVACKVDDAPHFLSDVAFVAYEIAHKFNPSALESIRQREFFRKQKELIVVAEKALLTTIDFDLDIQLTYKTLVVVLKRLNIPDLAKVAKVAWHLIDQWLQTSLCLQYKPHYIAAGSIALVARILEVKLPTEKGKIWWLEIDVAPEQLDGI